MSTSILLIAAWLAGLAPPGDEGLATRQYGETSVAFAPDGRWLVTGGADHAVRIRSGLVGVVEGTLTGHEAMVRSVAIAPDGRLIASGDYRGQIRFWDPERQECLGTCQGPLFADAMAFAPDGRTLAVGSGETFPAGTRPRDAPRLEGGQITLYDVAGRVAVRSWAADEKFVKRLCYAPDGRTLASVGDDRIVKLWDVDSGQLRRSIPQPEQQPRALAFTRDGTQLAVTLENNVRLWDVTTGELRVTLRGFPVRIEAMAFSADGGRLAVTGARVTALFDMKAPDAAPLLIPRKMPWRTVAAMAYAPDGRQLAQCFFDRTDPKVVPFQMVRLP